MDKVDLVYPPDVDDEISLIDLLAVLFRHKRFIIGISFSAVLISLLYALGSVLLPPEKSYLPNYYTPKATVLVTTSSSGGLSSMLGDAAGLASLAGISVGGGGGRSNGQLAVILAKSNATLDELNSEFGLTARMKIKDNPRSSTRQALLEKMTVSYDDKTTILSISFKDTDPVLAQTVVNRMVEILDRRFASLGGNKALNEKNRLESKLADVQAQINGLENRMNAFTSKYGIINVEAMATEQITVLAKLRSELILKDMEIENYEKFSKIDDPVILRLRSERTSISSKLAEVERGGTLLPSQKEIPKLAFEYATLKRDMAVQMEIFKLLTQQYEMAKLSAEGQEPAFQVFELAEVPDMKAGPSRGKIVLIASFAGFFLSIFGAFVIEAIGNILKNPETMKKLKGLS